MIDSNVVYLHEGDDPHCKIGRVRFKRGNVHQLSVVTPLPLDPQRLLASAMEKGLSKVVIMGETEDGRYFASSTGDASEVHWIAKMCLRDLDRIVDKMESNGRAS